MKCDFCSNDASIEIVVFVNGKARKLRMCPSCYEAKMHEFMEELPQEWGGDMLTEQIKSLMNNGKIQEILQEGLEMLSKASDDSFDEESLEMNKEVASARDIALEQQLRNLRKQRSFLLEEMSFALEEENYEECAKLRDKISAIGDDLVRLNEERMDPHGV